MKKIVIEGAGEVGSHLAKMLRAESKDVVVVDDDPERLSRLSSYADVRTVEGNPSSIPVLRSAGVQDADLFIAVYPFATQEVNIVGAMLAKKLGAAKVIARVNDEDWLTSDNMQMFREMGIEMMLYPEKSAADEIVSSLRHCSSEIMDFGKGKLQISAFKMNEDSPMLDLKLSEFLPSLDEDFRDQFRVIAISRGGNTIIPDVNAKFMFGDVVYIISPKESSEAVLDKFGRGERSVRSVMLLGGTPIGEMVAKSLSRHGIKVKIIDNDRDVCIQLSEKLPDDILIVNGDGRNPDFLFEEGIRDYDAFVSLTENDECNVLSCVVAKKFGVARTFAEVENIEYVRLAEEMGVSTVINKKLITAGRIYKYTLEGNARFVRYLNGTSVEVIEYTVPAGAAITKKALREIGFPRNAIIGGVIRNNESFIAVGGTRFQAFDRVAVFVLPDAVKEVDKLFR